MQNNEEKGKVKVSKSCPTLYTSQIVVHGILHARVLEWQPFPSPGDILNPGLEHRSPTSQADSLPPEPLTRESWPRESCYFSSVQSLSQVWLFATPWTAARQASLSITNYRSAPKLLSIESVMPSNHLIFCCPLLLLPSILPSIRVFPKESVLCIRWPKFGVSPSTSVLPMNTQDWSPLGWTGWISLQSKGLSRVFSNTTVQKHQLFMLSFLYSPTLTSIHDHRKKHSLD